MPTDILMPALSPTMEEGTVTRWLVKEGDAVAPGDIIAEIETDKATMDVEAVDEGTITELLIAAGTKHVKVNTPIAVMLIDGEEPSTKATQAAPGPVAENTTAEAEKSKPSGDETKSPENNAPKNESANASTSEAAPAFVQPKDTTQERVLSSPLARKLAHQYGIDLSQISGSGPNGRVVEKDVEAAKQNPSVLSAAKQASQSVGEASSTTEATAPQTQVSSTAAASSATKAPAKDLETDKVLALYQPDAYEVVPHDDMRKIIAERLTYSKQAIPHFGLSVDCKIDTLLRARKRMNEAAPKSGPHAYRLSVNDFIIKALGLALQQVPAANRTWTDAEMLQHKYSDIGVAVAVDGGLFTPIVRHCELKTLSEISNEMKDLAERARRKRLAPHEYQGGTTSISNLGMFGIKNFDAVINPPQASILAVGAGEQRPVVVDGSVEAVTIMSCTLSCDHRVIDGAIGADFLAAFKGLIEDPVRMLV